MIRLTLKEYMDDHGVTRYELSKRTGILFPVIDKYYKNQIVRYDNQTLDRICGVLGCSLHDILTYEPTKSGEELSRRTRPDLKKENKK